MKVLIGPSTFGQADSRPIDMLREAGVEIVPNPFGRKLTRDELLALLPGVEGIIAGLEPLSHDVLERSSLRVISRSGAGMSNVDVRAAEELKIAVRSTPDAPTEAVAELTVGALLSLLRSIPQMSAEMHEKKWTKRIGLQVSGRTIAIVGLGRIGRRVAELLCPFGARLLAVDPLVRDVPKGIELVPLERAIEDADVITIHASGDQQLLGEAELARVRKGVHLLNVGRGNLIDERALAAALRDGRVAGAWIDVFSEEPYSGELTGFSQVILTPHVGSATLECRTRMEVEAVENLLQVLRP